MTLRLKSRLFIPIWILCHLSGCALKSADDFPPLQFALNLELLDSTQTLPELGLAFKPPLKYIAVEDSVIVKIKENLRNVYEAEVPPFQPAAVFIDPLEPQNIILFSQIDAGFVENKDFPSFVREYDRRYRLYAPDAATTTFTVNDVRCWQSRRIIGRRVHFRWLLEVNGIPPRQCDFNYISNPAQNQGRVVESFLGSWSDKIKVQTKEVK